jgi:hypothetical protein
MAYLDVLVKTHGWSLMATAARYTSRNSGEVILALGYSEHHVYELIDGFTSGGDMGTDSENIFHEIPEYPIVRAQGIFCAMDALESKVKSLGPKIDDPLWRNDMAVRLQEHLDKVYRRV